MAQCGIGDCLCQVDVKTWQDIHYDGIEHQPATDRCVDCGLELVQEHFMCQNHQHCYSDCPRCGGELLDLRAQA